MVILGVVVVLVGFILKFDTLITVVVAGIVTGLLGGMSIMDILTQLGKSFISARSSTIFVLTLPVIGICERFGLKDKAVDFIKSFKRATAGGVLILYNAIRAVAAAFSLRIGGHPQFVRPLINPMAQGAAIAKYGEIDSDTEDDIKGYAAGAENYGNFFAQNCFLGASGTLLIVSTLQEQGFAEVTELNIAANSWWIAGISVIVNAVFCILLDKKFNKKYAAKAGK